MSANFSSSSNLPLHPPPPSSLNSSHLIYECFDVTVGSYIFAALSCSYILFFLPLCIFILHLGLQRWCKQIAVSAVMDLFTYNIVVMEMIGMLGSCFYCSGAYTNTPQLKLVGVYIFNVVTPGQVLFHILTCVERYVAVIHPIFYLGLRTAGGVRYISTGFVWVMAFGWVGLTALFSPNFPTIPLILFLSFSFVVTCFFNFFVLHALIRPGPGEGGGDRERVDQSKKKAFHTVMAITGTLLLRFGGQLICVLVIVLAPLSYRIRCVVLISASWLCLPSSYVLPLLFLHRAGKLPRFRYITDSGPGSV